MYWSRFRKLYKLEWEIWVIRKRFYEIFFFFFFNFCKIKLYLLKINLIIKLLKLKYHRRNCYWNALNYFKNIKRQLFVFNFWELFELFSTLLHQNNQMTQVNQSQPNILTGSLNDIYNYYTLCKGYYLDLMKSGIIPNYFTR